MHKVLSKIFQNHYDSFFLIAGPCAVESEEVCFEVAQTLKGICSDLDIPLIFKSSFKKANRTKVDSFQGIGDKDAIQILRKVKEKYSLPLTTDVHQTEDVALVNEVIDLIQIPAFLCRQTDLIVASAKTGKPVNIKKGQFMSGEAMKYAVDKVHSADNFNVLLTERGNSFGYQELIVDTRNVHVMSSYATTVMDVTHATQRPNQKVGISGGNAEEVELLGKVGLSAGAQGIFMEVHPDPTTAKSDGATMVQLSDVQPILRKWRDLSLSLRSIYQ